MMNGVKIEGNTTKIKIKNKKPRSNGELCATNRNMTGCIKSSYMHLRSIRTKFKIHFLFSSWDPEFFSLTSNSDCPVTDSVMDCLLGGLLSSNHSGFSEGRKSILKLPEHSQMICRVSESLVYSGRFTMVFLLLLFVSEGVFSSLKCGDKFWYFIYLFFWIFIPIMQLPSYLKSLLQTVISLIFFLPNFGYFHLT